MLTQEDIKNLKESLSDGLEQKLAKSLTESLDQKLTKSLKNTFVTKEYFDAKLLYLIENIGNKFESMENRFETLETSFDSKLAAQTDILIDYTHQAFESQQEYLDERFDDLIINYDVRDRVAKLEKRV